MRSGFIKQTWREEELHRDAKVRRPAPRGSVGKGRNQKLWAAPGQEGTKCQARLSWPSLIIKGAIAVIAEASSSIDSPVQTNGRR